MEYLHSIIYGAYFNEDFTFPEQDILVYKPSEKQLRIITSNTDFRNFLYEGMRFATAFDQNCFFMKYPYEENAKYTVSLFLTALRLSTEEPIGLSIPFTLKENPESFIVDFDGHPVEYNQFPDKSLDSSRNVMIDKNEITSLFIKIMEFKAPLAFQFFNRSYYEKPDDIASIIHAVTYLESTVLIGIKAELSYRLKTRLTALFSKQEMPMKNIFKFIGILYDLRSSIVHSGTTDINAYIKDHEKRFKAWDINCSNDLKKSILQLLRAFTLSLIRQSCQQDLNNFWNSIDEKIENALVSI